MTDRFDKPASGWSAPGDPAGAPGAAGGPGQAPGQPQPDGQAPPYGQSPPYGQAPPYTAPAAGWGQPAWVPPQAPKPGIVALRPLGLSDILDGAISAIRAHPRAMLGLSAVVVILTTVLETVLQWLALRDLTAQFGNPALLSDDDVFATLGASIAAASVPLVVSWLVQIVLTGILTIVVSRAVLGQQISIAQSWALARPRLLPLVGVSVLVGVALTLVGIGVLLPAVLVTLAGAPGAVVGVLWFFCVLAAVAMVVLLGVSFAFAGPAVVLEKRSPVEALKRSSRLVRGDFWRVFGILILSALITVVILSAISVPFFVISLLVGYDVNDPGSAYQLLPMTVTSIGSILGGIIVYPFAAAVTVLLYIDQRIRREGLDLELARAAGVAGPQGGYGSAPDDR